MKSKQITYTFKINGISVMFKVNHDFETNRIDVNLELDNENEFKLTDLKIIEKTK